MTTLRGLPERGDRRRWTAALLGDERLRPLTAVQSVTSAADAAFAVSLAGSLFFSVSTDAARPRLLLYLLFTLAPFAVIGPLLGPVTGRIRGGHRAVIIGTAAARAAACLVLATNLRSLVFIPASFAVLVLGKAAHISRSALVPRLTLDIHQLMTANARVARMATMGGLAGGGLGAAAFRIVGAPASAGLAAAGYLLASGLGTRIGSVTPTETAGARIVEVAELTAPQMNLAAGAMSTVRFAAGFMTFLVAFALKASGQPAWVFGMVLVGNAVAGTAGTVLGPMLRRRVGEDSLLGMALLAVAVACLLAAGQGARSGAVLATAVLGVAGAVAQQAFASTVQRLAPDTELGHVLARFDARFQLIWVVGAVGPVLLAPSSVAGFAVLGVALALGAVGYGLMQRSVGSRLATDATTGGNDPVPGMVALAHALVVQGEHNLAVLCATEAARVQSARRRDGRPLPTELTLLWLAASGGAPCSQDAAGRAIAIVEGLVGASSRPAGAPTPAGTEPPP